MPQRSPREFVAEGNVEIEMLDNCPLILVNDAQLAELLAYHFGAHFDDEGVRRIGKCKIIVESIRE